MIPARITIALMFLWSRARAQEPAPILLWPAGAPGSPAQPTDEHVRLTDRGDHIISNVHRPSLLPYLPDSGRATGTAVIVIPGGGHRELWMDHEGYRVGRWLAAHGVAAFVLKYRLAREPGSSYTVEGTELSDVQRAIRLVRSRAASWGIAPDRIGVIGFSAGGELAALAGTRDPSASAGPDSVDRMSAGIAFMGLVYPAIPAHLALSKQTAPAFLLCGAEDAPAIADGLATLYTAIRGAGGSAELHVLTGVGHGFGIRDDNPPAVAIWPTLFLNWLRARGLVPAAPPAPVLTPQMRDGIAGAQYVPRYTDAERAAAAQRVLKLPSVPSLSGTVTLTPDAPSAGNGDHLSFWKPSFVIGTPAGGEGGVNFWGLHNEGHINVGFLAEAGTTYLLDCRLLTTGAVTDKVYDGTMERFRDSSQVSLAEGHLLLMVAAPVTGGSVSVELWPAPVTQTLGFLGCDLSTASLR